jgi:succinate dehydrogenase / fumarate reductase cytochrome b subunit
MNIIKHIFQSSLGKKYVMAISGLCLFGFVIGHLVGNLQIFLGPEAINKYGHFLQSNPELIWPARIGLLVLVALHIWSAIKLEVENRSARPVAYGEYKPVGSSLASRTMVMSGLIVFFFIIYHLLHYTFKVESINLTHQNFAGVAFQEPIKSSPTETQQDIYKIMVVGFGHPIVSIFYVIAVGLLCLHLSHGASSMFQSLGWKNKAWAPVLNCGAKTVATLIFLGYISIPAAILFKIIK